MTWLPPRAQSLSQVMRLMLLFSRLELSDAQAGAAQVLCDEVEDWEGFRHLARDRFILPIVYRHLRRLDVPSLSTEQLTVMKQQVKMQYQHDLNVMASLAEIHQILLQPLAIPYVTFKGPSLAACYYDEPAMRFSRDIDILLPRERMAELLASALSAGFQPLDPPGLSDDPVALRFAARHQKVITLLSPRGVTVEFHSRIDNIGTVYDSRAMIERAEVARIGGADISVMPTDELFVYICWHHTKHFWSRLHWLVDLDAIQRHPSFDREKALACADRHALRSTVEVCMKMAEIMGAPEFEHHGEQDERLDQLLELSLDAMQGELEVEQSLAARKPTPDFAFKWQTDLVHCLRWQLMGWMRIFRPSYADYHNWPLPVQWHWIYRPLRPWRESRRRWSQSRQ